MNAVKTIFGAVIIFFLLVLLIFSVFGNKGLLGLNMLKKERDVIIKKNNIIQNSNIAMYHEIERLKHDQNYIESVARHKLGLIGKDDVILKVKQ